MVKRQRPLDLLALGLLLALIFQRLAYHAVYLTTSAFAHVTFSDGRLYEQGARAIVEQPPLGSGHFFLQGLYSYFLSVPLGLFGSIAAAVVFQVLVAAAALYLFHRSATVTWGKRVGLWAGLLLLSNPAARFYENKILSAELGLACNILVMFLFARWLSAPSRQRLVWVGVACGLTVLARPNMLLAIPFVLLAVHINERPSPRALLSTTLALGLGVCLSLAPMALRNQLVIGSPTVLPTHGGGTSFFIGNNPHARGVWNTGGGLFSGQVGLEQLDLAERLQIDEPSADARAAAIGRELYRRAFAFIREQPLDWLRLQAKKLWLLVGNDEITQDYDHLGEAEHMPVTLRLGLPFGFLLALGVMGLVLMWRRRSPADRAWLCVLGGQLLSVWAANVMFFTSSQHRVPLVPLLAFAAAPALAAVAERLSALSAGASLGFVRHTSRLQLILLVLLFGQALVPRSSRSAPSPAYYYNLAIAEQESGHPAAGVAALDRALEGRPDQPEFLLERAGMLLQLGRLDEAQADLDRMFGLPRLSGALRQRGEFFAGHIEAARQQQGQR